MTGLNKCIRIGFIVAILSLVSCSAGITSSGEIKIIKAFEFNPYGITEIEDGEDFSEVAKE